MEIKTVKINELKPHPKNPRVHPDSAIDKLVRSIKEYGWTNPVLVSADGYVLAGHARLKAAEKAGIEEVPVIYLPLEGAKAEAYLIADNRLQDETDWDYEKLEDLLQDLDAGDFDLELTGFDMGEIEDLMTQFHVPEEIIEDEVPEPPKEPITKLGDLWILGRHRLLCGDSTREEDIEVLIAGNKVDMIFTDPPYGMNLDTDYSGMKSKIFKGGIGGKKYEQGIVDEFTPEMIRIIMGLNVKETFIWGADYFAEYIPNRNEGSWIVWDKRANNNDDVEEDYSSDKMYGSCFELCWSRTKHKREIARVKWAGIFGLNSQDQNKRLHPTQKPLELCSWFISKYSNINDTILDLFGGSGSTLIACEQLNRTCYMMELDQIYCDVIVQRYINLKGHDGDVYLERGGNKIAFSNVT
jgi:DNA modification methylase